MNTTGTSTLNSPASAASLANLPAGLAAPGEVAGKFQALLNRQLPDAKEADSGLDQLLSLLSGMNQEQIAQLMLLLGMQPPNPSQPVALNPAEPESGQQPVRVDGQQLARALIDFLQNAGISPEEAIRSLIAAIETGANEKAVKPGGQLLDFVKSVQQAGRSDDAKGSGAPLQAAAPFPVDLKPLRQPEPLFMQLGSQLRPELAAMFDDAGGGPKLAGTQTVPPEPVAVQGHRSATNGQDVSPQTGEPPFSGGLNWVTSAGMSGSTASAGLASTAPVHVQMRADQLQADFPKVLIKQAAFGESNGVSEMRITLLPDGLGEIQVRIRGEGGQVALQIAADSQFARSLLDSGIDALKQQLAAQGVQVNRVEVVPFSASTASGTTLGMFDGQRQQRHAQPHNPRKGQLSRAGVIDDAAVWEQSLHSLQNGQFDVIA